MEQWSWLNIMYTPPAECGRLSVMLNLEKIKIEYSMTSNHDYVPIEVQCHAETKVTTHQ